MQFRLTQRFTKLRMLSNLQWCPYIDWRLSTPKSDCVPIRYGSLLNISKCLLLSSSTSLPPFSLKNLLIYWRMTLWETSHFYFSVAAAVHAHTHTHARAHTHTQSPTHLQRMAYVAIRLVEVCPRDVRPVEVKPYVRVCVWGVWCVCV